jgi:hypothetical protein
MYSQSQVDSIYFDFSYASDFVPRALLLKLDDYGLSAGYVNWCRGYLTHISLQVRYCGNISSLHVVLSGEQQMNHSVSMF